MTESEVSHRHSLIFNAMKTQEERGGLPMPLVLILTTGGSCEPLIKAIKQGKPDYTIFICSADQVSPIKEVGSHVTVDGPGKPCKIWGTGGGVEERESIVLQTSLGAEYEGYEKLLTSDVDNLAQCYQVAMEAIMKAKERLPGSRIRADYTGGTKTMSAALAMAAIDHGDIELYVVSGPRKDLIKISSGTEMLRQMDWMPIRWMRQRHVLEELFKTHDYIACVELIDDLCSQTSGSFATRKTLEGYLSICRGFQAWEEFRHQEAMEYLKPYGQVLSNELVFLSNVVDSYRKYEAQVRAVQGKGEGCVAGTKPNLGIIHDILCNAERRLQRGQYDDAVGRIYRALELLAQTCLLYRYPPIFTSNVQIDQLPEELRPKYQQIYEQQGEGEKRGLQLPLFKAYELLNDLKHPLGQAAWEYRSKMLDLVEIRNNSIFAHGLKSIDRKKAAEFYQFTCELLKSIENVLKLKVQYDKLARFPKKAPLSLELHW